MASGSYLRKIVFSGVIAALYAALTITLSFISYGPIQFRVAEALCILPFFYPFTIWGLFTGCIVANLISPYPLDIIVGPIATLLAALCTMRLGMIKNNDSIQIKALACFPPVFFNAVMIGAMISYLMVGAGEAESFWTAFIISGLQVGFGQLVILYALGLPLMIYLPKTKMIEKLEILYKGEQ